MKKYIIAIAIYLLGFNSHAQDVTKENNKIILTGSRFTYPLLNKWIEEYKKKNPEADFRLIPRGSAHVDSANLVINAHELSPEEIKPNSKVVNIGRYVILPVANEKNPLLPKYSEKGFDTKELKQLFFKKYDPLASLEEEPTGRKKEKYHPTLYTREQKACAPTTFARNFGFEQQDILGKSIGGDDNHLITAIKKDTNGITYNNLGFIYDIKTRKEVSGVKVIPIDINGNNKIDQEENFYNTLDDVIQKLETTKIPEITVGNINVSALKSDLDSNKDLSDFLTWILEEGQQYGHEYGFLSLEQNAITEQKEILLSSVK